MKINASSVLYIHNYTAQSLRTIKAHFTRVNPDALHARMSKTDFKGSWYLPVYTLRESDNAIILPQGCMFKLRQIIKEPIEVIDNRQTAAFNQELSLKMEDRFYQRQIIEKAARMQSGYFIAPCGAGKTNMFIGIIAKLQQRTLVVVHTTQLMWQFYERFKEVTGKAPGVFYSGKKEIKPVTIGVNKSILTHLVNRASIRTFGMVIVDECDLVPAPTMAGILNKCPAKYRFGATATYARYDQQEIMIDFLLGARLHKIEHWDLDRVHDPKLYFIQTGVRPKYYPKFTWDANNKVWVTKPKDKFRTWEKKIGPIQIGTLLKKQLLASTTRAGRVISIIIKEHNLGEVILVVCGTVIECELYQTYLLAKGVNAHVIVGDTKNKDREIRLQEIRDRKCRVLLGVNVVSRGMDVPNISRILVTVKRQTTQIIGRGTREAEFKTDLKVYELVDHYPGVENAFKRKEKELHKTYKKNTTWLTYDQYLKM